MMPKMMKKISATSITFKIFGMDLISALIDICNPRYRDTILSGRSTFISLITLRKAAAMEVTAITKSIMFQPSRR